MKLVYAISRWTNSSRAAARHIDNGDGLPLCGGNGRKAFSWETEEGEPTCDKCKQKAAAPAAPTDSADSADGHWEPGGYWDWEGQWHDGPPVWVPAKPKPAKVNLPYWQRR